MRSALQSLQRRTAGVAVAMIIVSCFAPAAPQLDVSGRHAQLEHVERQAGASEAASLHKEASRIATVKARQQALRADTARLLQIATELKAYADAFNTNMISVGSMQKSAEATSKADEAARIAQRLKQQMRAY